MKNSCRVAIAGGADVGVAEVDGESACAGRRRLRRDGAREIRRRRHLLCDEQRPAQDGYESSGRKCRVSHGGPSMRRGKFQLLFLRYRPCRTGRYKRFLRWCAFRQARETLRAAARRIAAARNFAGDEFVRDSLRESQKLAERVSHFQPRTR